MSPRRADRTSAPAAGVSPEVVFLATRSGRANGASLNAVRLAQACSRAGLSAEAWSFYSTDGEAPEGIARCFSPRPPRSIPQLLTLLTRASAALVSTRPRAVVGFHPLANVLGLSVAKAAGTHLRIASQRNPSSSQRPVLRALDKMAGTVGLYTQNVCVSPSVVRTFDGYPARYRARLTMIWNGVPEAETAVSAADARGRLGLPTDVPIIGTVGRLDPQKNQAVLIDALARTSGPHLAFAGDGILEADLRAQVALHDLEDRVHFLGNLERPQVGEFLAALDMFAFPSLYEGFGLALVEAMQHGLPCITSDIDIFRDILGIDEGHSSGLLVAPDLPDAWAAAFERLMRGEIDPEVLGANAQRRSRGFHLDAMTDGYLRLLR